MRANSAFNFRTLTDCQKAGIIRYRRETIQCCLEGVKKGGPEWRRIITAGGLCLLLLSSCRRKLACMDARLHGCTPKGMYAYRDVGGRPRLEQAVEGVDRVWNKRSRWQTASGTSGRGGRPRLEQAVEGVEPRLPAAGRSGTGGRSIREGVAGGGKRTGVAIPLRKL